MTKRLAPEIKLERKSITRACEFCHDKHIQCDTGRPCKNCIKRNIGDTCKDCMTNRKTVHSKGERGKIFVNRSSSSSSNKRKNDKNSHIIKINNDDSIESPSFIKKKIPNVDGIAESIFNIDLHPKIEQKTDSSIITNDDVNMNSMDGSFSPELTTFDSNWLDAEYSKLNDFKTDLGQQTNSNSIGNNDNDCNNNSSSSRIESPIDILQDLDFDLNTVLQDNLKDIFDMDNYLTTNLMESSNMSLEEQKNNVDVTVGEPSVSVTNDMHNRVFRSMPYISLDTNVSESNKSSLYYSGCSVSQEETSNHMSEKGELSPLQYRSLVKTRLDLYNNPQLLKAHDYNNALSVLGRTLTERYVENTNTNEFSEMMKQIRNMPTVFTPELFIQEFILQRELLDYEEMLRFVNCTPVVIWRRTGELCFVSNEYLSMTGFSRIEMLSKPRFVFEYWDINSICKYFHHYNNHLAFEEHETESSDTQTPRSPNYGHCNVLLRNNIYLRCAVSWTVKRDNFKIPVLIVGQFLPIFM